MTTLITAGSTIVGVPKYGPTRKLEQEFWNTIKIYDWNGNSIENNNNITFNVGEKRRMTLIKTISEKVSCKKCAN